jgi:hypothetical protein
MVIERVIAATFAHIRPDAFQGRTRDKPESRLRLRRIERMTQQ